MSGDASPVAERGRFEYEPALDGLRGIALLGVVAYHAGIDELRGGFLGVSSFFTLSGFLITFLLLLEHDSRGRIDLVSFWARRLRRLLPAALVTILATVMLAAAVADDSQLARLRADGLASLFHYSNWHFIAEGDSYGALFRSPSFFRHFWSLSVEEQYYAVFPVGMAAALSRLGRGRRFTTGLVTVSACALVWPVVLSARGASADRLYFGTDTRLGELAVGALFALWWVRRTPDRPAAPMTTTVAPLAAVIAIAAMWAGAHPGDEYLYRGGLAVHAGLTLVVIRGAIAPASPVRTILGWEPLRRLGVVSYGAYLIHWPVLLWLQQETSLGPATRLAAGLGITITLAAASHHVVERPVRRLPATVIRRMAPAAVLASLLVAALVVAITTWQRPERSPIDFAAARDRFDAVVDSAPEPGPTGVPGDGDGAHLPVRIAGFGDSTALMTGVGLIAWAEDHVDQVTMVPGRARLGCGLVTGGERRLEDRVIAVPDECEDWLAEWPEAIAGKGVDVAVVQLGAWEIVDHRPDGDDEFMAIGRSPEYELRQLDQLRVAVDALLTEAELVILLAHPDVGPGRLDSIPAGVSYPEYDPARSRRWREMVEGFAAPRERVAVIDLAGFVRGHDDRRLRPDGVHFDIDAAEEVADWLGPEILAAHVAHRSGT